MRCVMRFALGAFQISNCHNKNRISNYSTLHWDRRNGYPFESCITCSVPSPLSSSSSVTQQPRSTDHSSSQHRTAAQTPPLCFRSNPEPCMADPPRKPAPILSERFQVFNILDARVLDSYRRRRSAARGARCRRRGEEVLRPHSRLRASLHWRSLGAAPYCAAQVFEWSV
jgi:hypothetical protein